MLASLSLFAIVLCCEGPGASGLRQDQDQNQERQTREQSADDAAGDQQSVVTDEHREVWTLQAQSAAKAGGLNDDQTAALTELYVESRSKFADAEDYLRDEWRAEMRAKLEQQRAEGEVTGEIFDTTELERTIDVRLNSERTKLAEALVKLLEQEVAEKVYPLLGGFDKRTDGAVRDLIGFGLEDEGELECVAALQQYYVDATKARMLPVGESGPAARTAQETLIHALSPHLEREQLMQVARKVGVRFRE